MFFLYSFPRFDYVPQCLRPKHAREEDDRKEEKFRSILKQKTKSDINHIDKQQYSRRLLMFVSQSQKHVMQMIFVGCER
jgi:hypothetical protein